MSLGWVQIQADLCAYKKRTFGHRHTQREDHVKKNRKQLSISQEEWLWKKPILPIPWSQTFSLQNCEKTNLLFKPLAVYFLSFEEETWHAQVLRSVKGMFCLLLRVLPFEKSGILGPPIMDCDTEKRGIVITVKITKFTRWLKLKLS